MQQPAPLTETTEKTAAQKKKDKKKKKKMEEQKNLNEEAKNTSIQNLSANQANAPKAKPQAKKNDDLDFETVTGKRAVLSKEDRKQRERKDSLDDYSSGSDSDVEVYVK